MRTRLASLFHRTVVAGGFSLVIPFSGMAADNAPPEALNVKVFPDRYVAAGKSFADLAGLEAWAKPILLRALWLDNCSPASTKQLLAAVERFIRRFGRDPDPLASPRRSRMRVCGGKRARHPGRDAIRASRR